MDTMQTSGCCVGTLRFQEGKYPPCVLGDLSPSIHAFLSSELAFTELFFSPRGGSARCSERAEQSKESTGLYFDELPGNRNLLFFSIQFFSKLSDPYGRPWNQVLFMIGTRAWWGNREGCARLSLLGQLNDEMIATSKLLRTAEDPSQSLTALLDRIETLGNPTATGDSLDLPNGLRLGYDSALANFVRSNAAFLRHLHSNESSEKLSLVDFEQTSEATRAWLNAVGIIWLDRLTQGRDWGTCMIGGTYEIQMKFVGISIFPQRYPRKGETVVMQPGWTDPAENCEIPFAASLSVLLKHLGADEPPALAGLRMFGKSLPVPSPIQPRRFHLNILGKNDTEICVILVVSSLFCCEEMGPNWLQFVSKRLLVDLVGLEKASWTARRSEPPSMLLELRLRHESTTFAILVSSDVAFIPVEFQRSARILVALLVGFSQASDSQRQTAKHEAEATLKVLTAQRRSQPVDFWLVIDKKKIPLDYSPGDANVATHIDVEPDDRRSICIAFDVSDVEVAMLDIK